MRRILPVILLIIYCGTVQAAPSTDRLLTIKLLAQSMDRTAPYTNITILVNPDLPGPAGAFRQNDGTFQIFYNPTIFDSLPESGRRFVLHHELGHIHLGHVNMEHPGLEQAKEYELEADAFATFLYKHETGLDAGFFEFLTMIEARTHTIPSGPERALVCRLAAEL